MIRFERRASTAVADAYLSPLIQEYLGKFQRGFQHSGNSGNSATRISFMMSDGGLCPIQRFTGFKAVLSGPAGGVIGYSRGLPDRGPLIGFDMGGTSTDVSRCDGTALSHTYHAVIAGVKIQSPQLDVITVAAGGGSRLTFHAGLLAVGPESAGASPGPVCYRKPGGVLAVTDANLVLGRIVPELFPNIFGPNADQPLDVDGAVRAMEELAAQVNAYRSRGGDQRAALMTAQDLALGFIDVANEAMCRPIRNITEARGFAASTHSLACFGGAGGQHACAIARVLGIEKVYCHRYASVLSAYGIGMADSVEEVQAPLGQPLDESSVALQHAVEQRFAALASEGAAKLRSDGFAQLTFEYFLNLRFKGTDTALMIAGAPNLRNLHYRQAFEAEYKREFGFLLRERDIIVDDVRVRVVAPSSTVPPPTLSALSSAQPVLVTQAVFSGVGRVACPVYLLKDLGCDASVSGPAMLADANNTIVIEPQCRAVMLPDGCVLIHVARVSRLVRGARFSSVSCLIHGHRGAMFIWSTAYCCLCLRIAS